MVLTLAVKSVMSGGAGVTVLSGKAWLADAGAGTRVWPAGVTLRTGSIALTV